jgi:IS5 family transposase
MKTSNDIVKSTNWKQYNQALINRGSLTLWIDQDITDTWTGSGKCTYSKQAIELLLTFKALYHMPLRMTQGYTQSLFALCGVDLPVPNYTTLSRRAKNLCVSLQKKHKGSVSIILDSTGCKVYGEGEWKVRKHGWCYRRTWKKLHIGIDTDGEIRAIVTTNSKAHDVTAVDSILKQEKEKITDFYGDGAYDAYTVYQSLLSRGVTGFHIPPQRNAKIQIHGNTKTKPYPRDTNLRAIRKSTRKKWKKDSGYHTRSLGETVMYRFKNTFGQHLSFRKDASQTNEVLIKANILNRFLGLSVSG